MDRSIIVSVLIQMLCIRWTSTAEPIFECIGNKPLFGNPPEVSLAVTSRGNKNVYRCRTEFQNDPNNPYGLLWITISPLKSRFVTVTCTYNRIYHDITETTWTINGEPVPMEKVNRTTQRQLDGIYHTSLSMNVPSDDEENFSCI